MFASAPAERPSERHVVLHRQTAELLARPIRGNGDFPALLRRIQAGLLPAPTRLTPISTGLGGGDVFHGDMLCVDAEDITALFEQSRGGRLRRHRGFRRRVVALLVDVMLNNTAYPEARRGQLRLPFDAPPATVTSLRLVRGGRPPRLGA